jgi:hypothetical protein
MVCTLISPFLVCLSALVVIDAAHVKRDSSFPNFVLNYAPVSYLHPDEQYWPSDIATFLDKVVPQVDFETVDKTPTLRTLSTLTNDVYLTAVDSVRDYETDFFTSTVGKPADGVSVAPATIIVVEKPDGITDAFYFYFFSWNLGNV